MTVLSALAPYPTVVCADTGTFLPPCKAPAAPSSGGLCLNVGAPLTKPFARLQLYHCVATPNEAFTFDNTTGLVSVTGGCLDGALHGSAAPACIQPPCVAVSDSCDTHGPKGSQRWSKQPVASSLAGSPKFRIVHTNDKLCLAATSAAAHASMTLVKCSAGSAATLQEWTELPHGQIELASSSPSKPPPPSDPVCCRGEYVSPSTFGHFAGQKHVEFGSGQDPYSLPVRSPQSAVGCDVRVRVDQLRVVVDHWRGHRSAGAAARPHKDPGPLSQWPRPALEQQRDNQESRCRPAVCAGARAGRASAYGTLARRVLVQVSISAQAIKSLVGSGTHLISESCCHSKAGIAHLGGSPNSATTLWSSTVTTRNTPVASIMTFLDRLFVRAVPLLGPNNNGSMGTRRHEWFEVRQR